MCVCEEGAQLPITSEGTMVYHINGSSLDYVVVRINDVATCAICLQGHFSNVLVLGPPEEMSREDITG